MASSPSDRILLVAELRRWAQNYSRRDALVMEAWKAGIPIIGIAESTGLGRSTVQRILRRGLPPAGRGGVRYRRPLEPVFPCREMPTRHCPAVYGDVCGDRPCARFDSNDPTPWRGDPG